jgi:hypothetical protein
LLLLYDWQRILLEPGIFPGNEYTISIGSVAGFLVDGIHLNSGFLHEPEFWGGMVTFIMLFWELMLFFSIWKVLGDLFRQHQLILTASRAAE